MIKLGTFLLGIGLLIISSGDAADSIQGYYHAWWAIIPLPKATVEKMMPAGHSSLVLADVSSLMGLPAGYHPIVLEIGEENDAGPIGFPKKLLMDFPEFKYDIPYIIKSESQDDSATSRLNYKSIVYTDSDILSISSQVEYNLNAQKASMDMTDSTYNVVYNGLHFSASFHAVGDLQPPGAFPYFDVYQDIMSQTWFGSYQSSRKTCADHHYVFDTMQLRPANMTMEAEAGVLDDNFPTGQIHTSDLTNPLGTVEVWIHFTISYPYDCLP